MCPQDKDFAFRETLMTKIIKTIEKDKERGIQSKNSL